MQEAIEEHETFSQKNGLPQLVLNQAKLREALKLEPSDTGDDESVDPIGDLWDADTDADSINKLVNDAQAVGAIESPDDWQIIVYPREINDGFGYVLTVWSSANYGFCHIVVQTGEMRELASRELWDGDDGVERSIAIVNYLVECVNGAAPHLVGAENAAAKIYRHYEERPDGWVLLNQLATDNNAKEGRPQLEREQRFDTVEEAIAEVERLIAHFHTVYVTENLDADLPVDLNIEHFISATKRLEAFRRAEVGEWSLFEDDEAITLKFDPPEVPF